MQSFLVIRRDNIGDLVCTTPLIAALRQRYQQAHIAALVNTYNRDVLANNPDLDEVHAYGKAKHRGERESLVGTYAARLRLVLALRKRSYDCAILAAPGFQPRSLRLARMTGAKHILGFVQDGSHHAIDMAVPVGPATPRHEVEDVLRLLAPLGIEGPPPPLRVVADEARLATMRSNAAARLPGAGPLVALHVSARKPSQRWPAERWVELIAALRAAHGARLVLLWAPGSERNRRHPGDDGKARAIVQAANAGEALLPVPTFALGELIAALAACSYVVCADGGAMHLAAALHKPLVAMFGDSDPARWRPWRAPHRLIQPASRDVRDVTVSQVMDGFAAIRSEHPTPLTPLRGASVGN